MSQLLDRLAEAVDLPGGFSDSPETFISRTRAIEYLSDSVHAFSQKTIASNLLATTTTISVEAGTTEYDLPDDFAALINLTYAGQDGYPRKIVRADIDEIDLTQPTNSDGWTFRQARYAIMGESIVMTDPRASYAVTVRYVPELPMYSDSDEPIPDFSADDDYILCKGAIDQWVVLDSAIKCLRKQQIDPGAVIAARDEIELNLLNNVVDRNTHDAQQVRNAWDQNRGGGWGDGRR